MNRFIFTATEARQGAVGHGMRYVLGLSMGLVVVAMTMALKFA
jgi:hypothetical protein